MAIDWDAELLGPVMAEFGEGRADVLTSLPLYYPKRGTAFRLRDAVFDPAYQQVTDLGDDTTSTSSHPVLGVRESLFAPPPGQGDYVYIPSADRTYAVKDPEADGHGHVLLILIESSRGMRSI